MPRHKSIHPHSLTKTVGGDSVPHYLIGFDPATKNFFHRETGKEIRINEYSFIKDYASWFILKTTVSLVDGTTADSSQIYCDPETGACVDRTTHQPVELQPNQIHFVVIDHQNESDEINYISILIQTEIANNHKKQVRAIQVRKEGWNLFYYVEYENTQIHLFNFDELILSKVVNHDGGTYFFYSMRSPTYNAFGSIILFHLV